MRLEFRKPANFKICPGGITGGVTPLPIPNRVVKPARADGTILVTRWESRSLPGFLFAIDKETKRSRLGMMNLRFQPSVKRYVFPINNFPKSSQSLILEAPTRFNGQDRRGFI